VGWRRQADHLPTPFKKLLIKLLACRGCADVFGATEDAEKSGFDLIKDNPVPGTTGLQVCEN